MSETEGLTPRERQIVREAMAQAWDTAVAEVQKIIAESDQDAARNGNVWWQGRLSGLGSAEDRLAELARAADRG